MNPDLQNKQRAESDAEETRAIIQSLNNHIRDYDDWQVWCRNDDQERELYELKRQAEYFRDMLKTE